MLFQREAEYATRILLRVDSESGGKDYIQNYVFFAARHPRAGHGRSALRGIKTMKGFCEQCIE